MVTDPQTNNQTQSQTHRQDRLQYTAPLSLARSVIKIKTERMVRSRKAGKQDRRQVTAEC